jgi:hypothetical protein
VDPEAILHELTYAKELPREAVVAASARREEMVPIFLREIESFIATPPEGREEPSPLFFIFHLLGEWREKRAYRPLAHLLRDAGDDAEWILGDGKRQTAHRVMVAVYDGDPQPLKDIILDPDANEFVRDNMFDALTMLVLSGEADRAEATQFLRDCFTDLRPQAECMAWYGWQSAVAALELRELAPQVKKAFDRDFVPITWMTYEEFEEDLDGGPLSVRVAFQRGDQEYSPFGSVVDELADYVWNEPDDDLDPFEDEKPWGDVWQEPAVNPYKNVGRNDPCPCGSGKKFKKCCLQA